MLAFWKIVLDYWLSKFEFTICLIICQKFAMPKLDRYRWADHGFMVHRQGSNVPVEERNLGLNFRVFCVDNKVMMTHGIIDDFMNCCKYPANVIRVIKSRLRSHCPIFKDYSHFFTDNFILYLGFMAYLQLREIFEIGKKASWPN